MRRTAESVTWLVAAKSVTDESGAKAVYGVLSTRLSVVCRTDAWVIKF